MPPKKDVKKQPVVQQPVIQQPVIPPHQLAGYGRFDYSGGVTYVGQWRLVNGIKTKHGKGILTIPGQGFKSIGQQKYEGQWVEDKMCGKGIYFYGNGAVYQGQFKNNKHHGQGKYQFPNATIYQGQWLNGLMHGTGFYVDVNGRKWEGQFRNGRYETKLQQELGRLKKIQLKKQIIKKQITLGKSDKKTLKDNMAPFFVVGDSMKQFIKDPYSKVDQRPQQKWVQVINILKNGKIKVLGENIQSQVLGSDRIIGSQLKGSGQVVQIQNIKQQRTVKCAFGSPDGNVWNLVIVQDQQKKK